MARFIELQVRIAGGTATVQREVRGQGQGKVLLCHRTDGDIYNAIDVSVNPEPAHRAHGDGKVGEAVPGSPGRVFTSSCAVQ